MPPNKMPDGMSEYMPSRMPGGMPEYLSNRMPDGMSEYMPNKMPDGVSEYLPNRMPDGMPEYLQNRMPVGMSGTFCDRCSYEGSQCRQQKEEGCCENCKAVTGNGVTALTYYIGSQSLGTGVAW